MLARVVALGVTAVAGVYLALALTLPFGSTARPGAGFFPTAVALFACAAGLVATAQAFRAPAAVRTPRAAGVDPSARNRVISTVVVLVVFCLLMPWLGYPLVAFAFVATLLRRLGGGWRGALLTGVLAAVSSHYLFAVLLDVPLPRGPW
jgi:putative tricarboxylic transport membrane protein